jgi:hypothetical protein
LLTDGVSAKIVNPLFIFPGELQAYFEDPDA